MSTISVPIPQTLEDFINEMINCGIASNKAEVVRQALVRFAEDQAIEAVLRSEQELREKKVLCGDLRKIAKRFP
ncbi:type II toxin-antitoxin system ParD family antitoxin [Patescibacteria group bacterium]